MNPLQARLPPRLISIVGRMKEKGGDNTMVYSFEIGEGGNLNQDHRKETQSC